MSISDRVIVMRRGAIAQVGKPKEVYYRPVSPYVAHFIGETNFLKDAQCDFLVDRIVLGKQNPHATEVLAQLPFSEMV